MKSNFEKAFENSLKDYEVPYDPSAWEALSTKLDGKIVKGAEVGIKRWLLVAGLAMFIIAGSYVVWPEKGSVTKISEQQTQQIDKTVETEASDKMVVVDTDYNNNLTKEQAESEEANSVKIGEPGSDKHIGNSIREEIAENNIGKQENGTEQTDKVTTTPLNTPSGNEGDKETYSPIRMTFIPGIISPKAVCKGESFGITNGGMKGELVHWYISENGDGGVYGILKAGETIEYTPTANTTVVFKSDKDTKIEEVVVTVSPTPSADFAFEANIYEDGLPVVNFETFNDYAEYKWTFDNEGTSDKAEPTHNFFEKGNYEVTLEAVNASGCISEITKTVSIHKKYNLMAVDAFIPNGTDPRNRTFIPYSLTERDVKFQLTIVDPMTNELIFTSNNPANAWDGRNQRTGKMTESAKAYIWKVQIYNPLPNERPIYTGTIVHN